MAAARTVWFSIPFKLPQISCFTLSLKCFSSDSDNCPNVGIRHLLQFPNSSRVGPVLLSLLFFPLVPSSYQVLCGSIFFSAGQLLLSTLVCMHFCVWMCIPDVSMEGDVLHIHLLLRHLVPQSLSWLLDSVLFQVWEDARTGVHKIFS